MSRELEYHNAKIVSTSLGIEDRGLMTSWLTLEWPGAGVSFGGFALDGFDKELGERRDSIGLTGEYIKAIMDTVGVDKWEDLKGKYVVVEGEGWGGRATGIRNVLDEDKWFRPKEWFENYLGKYAPKVNDIMDEDHGKPK